MSVPRAPMPPSLAGLSPDAVQHAEHVWKFLDELAQSDPDAYKKFVSAQMDEAKAEAERKTEGDKLFTPTPGFVIYTRHIPKSSSSRPEFTLYINVASSPSVPSFQTHDKRPATGHEAISDLLVPLSVSKLRDADVGTVVDVVMNPKVIERCEAESGFRFYLIELCLASIEEDHSLHLHRAYKNYTASRYVGEQIKHRNEAEIARQNAIEQLKKEKEQVKRDLKTKQSNNVVLPTLSVQAARAAEEQNQHGLNELKLRPDPVRKPLIQDLTPDDGLDEELRREQQQQQQQQQSTNKPQSNPLIQQITPHNNNDNKPPPTATATAATAATANASSTAANTSSNASSTTTAPFKSSAKMSDFITSDELMSSLATIGLDQQFQLSRDAFDDEASHAHALVAPSTTPEHTVSLSGAHVSVTVLLPGVSSIADIALDIASNNMQLAAANYQLNIQFPKPVAYESPNVQAKFIKKQHKLSLTLPLQ